MEDKSIIRQQPSQATALFQFSAASSSSSTPSPIPFGIQFGKIRVSNGPPPPKTVEGHVEFTPAPVVIPSPVAAVSDAPPCIASSKTISSSASASASASSIVAPASASTQIEAKIEEPIIQSPAIHPEPAQSPIQASPPEPSSSSNKPSSQLEQPIAPVPTPSAPQNDAQPKEAQPSFASASAAAASKSAPKSWANLAKSNGGKIASSSAAPVGFSLPPPSSPPLSASASSPSIPPPYLPRLPPSSPTPSAASSSTPSSPSADTKQLGRQLLQQIRSQPPQFSIVSNPRGLVNPRNTCFMNSILQSLLYCPPFHHLLTTVSSSPLMASPMDTPFILLKVISRFFSDFHNPAIPSLSLPQTSPISKNAKRKPAPTPPPALPSSSLNPQVLTPFRPFSPVFVLDALKRPGQRTAAFTPARQEDAQEFLNVLLDALHEEFRRLTGGGASSIPSSSSSSSSEKESHNAWNEKGKGKSSNTVQETVSTSSPITQIFGGLLRSLVQAKGGKGSATIQPYLSLPLEIVSHTVRTLDDAFDCLTQREHLESFMSEKKHGVEVEASKRITLEKLPPVLVLHLKRFTFNAYDGNPVKVTKHIAFPATYTVQEKHMSSELGKSGMPSEQERRYRLMAVVNHHGVEAQGGHYTADVYQMGAAAPRWLRVDDDKISCVEEKNVLDQSAYLLFYVKESLVTKSGVLSSSAAAAPSPRK